MKSLVLISTISGRPDAPGLLCSCKTNSSAVSPQPSQSRTASCFFIDPKRHSGRYSAANRNRHSIRKLQPFNSPKLRALEATYEYRYLSKMRTIRYSAPFVAFYLPLARTTP